MKKKRLSKNNKFLFLQAYFNKNRFMRIYKMSNVEVTVLMPVYNGEKYLQEAIESILNQTFENFEFLIMYDESSDNSLAIIKSYNDPRIHLICEEKGMGLVSALNKGINLAEGKYIARMDCDDISMPERLEKQVKFMNEHQEIGVCGSWIEEFGEVKSRIFKYPTEHDLIKSKLFFFCALAHSSVIMRKSMLKKHNLYYSQEKKEAEDFELWQRCSFYFQMANIPEVLLKYRIISASKRRQAKEGLKNAFIDMDRKNLSLMGLEADDEILEFHQAICPLRPPEIPIDKNFVIKAEKWLTKINIANIKTQHYPEQIFSQLLGERWLAVCNKNAEKYGIWAVKTFWQSPLSSFL